jgi:hypothetical protein
MAAVCNLLAAIKWTHHHFKCTYLPTGTTPTRSPQQQRSLQYVKNKATRKGKLQFTGWSQHLRLKNTQHNAHYHCKERLSVRDLNTFQI